MTEVSGSGGGIEISVDLFRATIANAIVEDISAYLRDGFVDMNVDRAVKLAASFALREPDIVTPYTDYLAPFLRLTYDDGTDEVYQQIGLYAVTVPPGGYTPDDAGATFDGSDLTAVLAQAAYTNTQNATAGFNYATEIRNGITNGGITRHNIPATTETLPTNQSFPPGTTRLEKANTLLSQLGWYHLGTDLDGKVSTPGPSRNLSSMEPWRELIDTDLLVPVDVQPGSEGIANVVVVINNDGTAAPLTATARNDDPSSPTSTVGPEDGGIGLGRSIVRKVEVQGSTTQAALNALAARYLAESRTYYRTAKATILPDPSSLIPHQIVRLTLTGKQAGLSGLWWVRTSRIGFQPATAATVLELNQVTDDINGVTI